MCVILYICSASDQHISFHPSIHLCNIVMHVTQIRVRHVMWSHSSITYLYVYIEVRILVNYVSAWMGFCVLNICDHTLVVSRYTHIRTCIRMYVTPTSVCIHTHMHVFIDGHVCPCVHMLRNRHVSTCVCTHMKTMSAT